MTVKVYVNWAEEEVVSEAEYKKLKEAYIKEPDEYELSRYLMDNHDMISIFFLNEKEKEEILNDFVDEFLDEYWEMVELEV